jgi:hypothetical protein
MYTVSGRYVTRNNFVAPSLKDIAIHTGRIVRFGGGCRTWWTVLHHHLACGLFATYYNYNDNRVRLYAYLHDAHEAITSDVPRDWKPAEMSHFQAELDMRIYTALAIPYPSSVILDTVKEIDNVLLLAEAQLVGPKGIMQHPTLIASRKEFANILPIALNAVQTVQRKFPSPEDTIYETSEAVKDYILKVRNAIKELYAVTDEHARTKRGVAV